MSFPLDNNICDVTYFRFYIPDLIITESSFSCKTLILNVVLLFECHETLLKKVLDEQ
jgi:hypothetical protein